MAFYRPGIKNYIGKSLIAFLLASGAQVSALDTLVKQKGGIPLQGGEEFDFIGWNDACSTAIQHLRYPRVGRGLEGVPSWWRIGALTIPPGMERMDENWSYRSEESSSWNQEQATRTTEDLVRSGYTRLGYAETVRDAPVSRQPGLKQILETPSVFKFGTDEKWPSQPYRLASIKYSSLGNCALFIFENRSGPVNQYSYKLVRVLNPGVRRIRARAHATNGILLYKNSDLYAAEEELAIAAEMDPDYALGRYYHSLFLSALGRFDQALDELKAALHLDKRYAEKARAAPELESLRGAQRFKTVLDEEAP